MRNRNNGISDLHYTLLLLIQTNNPELIYNELDLHYTLLLLIRNIWKLCILNQVHLHYTLLLLIRFFFFSFFIFRFLFTLHFATINTTNCKQDKWSNFNLHYTLQLLIHKLFRPLLFLWNNLHYTLLLLIPKQCNWRNIYWKIYITLCYC